MKKNMLQSNEKKILFFIRYTPILLILILSISVTIYTSFELSKYSQKSIENITENYTQINKEKIKDKVDHLHKYIIIQEKNSLYKLKENLKLRVKQAHNIAINIYNKNKDTKTKDEIIKLIKDAITSISLENKSKEIYALDINSRNIFSSLKDHIYKQPKKISYYYQQTIQNIIKTKSEKFSTQYQYKNIEDQRPYKKITYYKYFEPFDVILGAEEYLIDFENSLKKEILQYINFINLNSIEYFFILDYKGKILSHPNKKYINNYAREYLQDQDKIKFDNTVKNKGGYVSYVFQTREKELHLKTTFMKDFKIWNWIIGTGYDDVKLSKKISLKKAELEDQVRDQLIALISISIFFTILFMLISLYITQILKEKFINYQLDIKKEEDKREKEAIKNARIYKDIFESNKSIILLINPLNGDIINANKSARDFYGYKKEKLLSLNISDINILSKEECQKEIEHAIEDKKGYFNFIHRLANGEKRNVRVTSSISTYLDMTVLFSIINDVTNEYEIKGKLSESENEFKSLFEFSNIGLGIRDTNGNFTKVNQKLIDMLGYEENELLNDNCMWISLDTTHEEEIKLFKNLIAYKIKNYNIEKTFIRKDGSKFEAILTMATILNNKKEITQILSSIIDVSEIKKKDNLIFQQSKMAAMGEMIGNIAHQWKQPLNLIGMSNNVIKLNQEIEDVNSKKEINDAVEQISNGIKYLSSTIDDFRNFFIPNKELDTFNIEKTIEKTMKLTLAQLKSKQIIIEKDINPIVIKSYENELIQVLINIFNNSKDAFISEQKVKVLFIKIFKEENKLIIKIKDNAGGIPENIITKVFDPYFTTKDKTKGTGIGLYMSEEIISKHMNGQIFVENVEYRYNDITYKGAQFTIELDII